MICALINNLFDLYLENRLIRFQARWVESHIALCPHCAAELSAWKKMMRELRALPAPQAPANLQAAIKAALAGTEASQPAQAEDGNFALLPGNVPALAFAFSFLIFLMFVSGSVYGPGISSQACSDDPFSICAVNASNK